MATSAERVLRLTLQFLDLSRDVDRNIDDSLLRDEGDEIVYVFDANVFEVFMRPFDHRGQSTSLHAMHWGGELPIGRTRRTSIAAQTALLTTEFLLSGELPAQRGGIIYLTEWHSWEYARRVRYLVEKQGATLSGKGMAHQLQRLNALVRPHRQPGDGAPDDLEKMALEDPILAADLADIDERDPLSRDDRRAFILNRMVLELLATDENLEPIAQLSRLLTGKVRRRLRILHTDFPPTGEAAKRIGADAKTWLERLRGECGSRGIRVLEDAEDRESEAEHSRRLGALRDDARTLAFVRWAAVNRVAPGQRMVLVTADNVMFDVYRRWYAELHPAEPEYAEPFILRRLLQYAPIFNLADSRNALGDDVRQFFRRLQSVIEVTLLPINLARQQARSQEHQGVISRMRELTALRALDERALSEDVAYRNLREAIEHQELHEHRLSRLVDEWRRLERTTLGASDDYVRQRLVKKREDYPELFADELSQGAVTEYIARLIAELYDGSLKLWLPLARDVVLQWEPPRNRVRARAPIAFRLYLADEAIDLGQAVDDRLRGLVETPLRFDMDWAVLGRQPQALFGLAACLALASEDWGNADHFAEMALREPPSAAATDTRQTTIPDRQAFELRYLNALTKRFRIGAIGPARNVDALGRVRRVAKEAAELLESCIEHHGRSDSSRPQTLRLIRALSERAALHLFHAAAVTPAVRSAPVRRGGRGREGVHKSDPGFSSGIAETLKVEAIAALSAAQYDLVRCFELARREQPPDGPRSIFLQRLREQFGVNVAATCVLRRLLNPEDEQPWSGFPEPMLQGLEQAVVEGLLELAVGRSPLLAAELLAFLSLRGRKVGREQLAALSGKRFDPTLSLDASLFGAITTAFAPNPRP
jgi:hypothetical protein